jgi:hypothetical protein
MGVRIENGKYIIENPDGTKVETGIGEGQLFSLGGGSQVGVIKNGTFYSGEAGKVGVDTSGLASFEDVYPFLKERGGSLNRAYGDQTADFWKQFTPSSGNITTATYGSGFGQPVSQMTPASLSSYEQKMGMATTQQSVKSAAGNQTFQTAAWQDPTTGQTTPNGVGMPKPSANTPPAGATYISNPAELKGLKETDIWRDLNSNKIYKLQKATLTNSQGQQKVVTVGSTEANNLLNNGWTLGNKIGGGTITAALMTPTTNINIATPSTTNTYAADTAQASAKATSDAADAEIKRLQELLTPPETSQSKQLDELYKLLGTEAQDLTGRGEMQKSEEEKRQIEEKTQALASKNTELKSKLAEIDALTASYNLANQQEEGRPQTLSRLQGSQAANYKMFLAQKNLLTSQASYIQADISGMQGELTAAQDAANRAVELEYSDRESKYNATLAQLNILMPQLEKEDKTYASGVQLYLENQQSALDEEKAAKKEQNSVILDLISKYPDANISFSDDLATAQSKIKNSRIYQQSTRLAGGGSGSGSGGDGSTVKLTTTQKTSLLTAFTADDLPQIQSDINEYGANAVIASLTNENEKNAVRKAFGIANETATIDKSLQNLGFSPDEIRKYKTEQENYGYSPEPLAWLNQYRKKSSNEPFF